MLASHNAHPVTLPTVLKNQTKVNIIKTTNIKNQTPLARLARAFTKNISSVDLFLFRTHNRLRYANSSDVHR